MTRRLITDSPELQARFDEAGTTAVINDRGQVAVTNWPSARWSGGGSNFLRYCDEVGRGLNPKRPE